MHLVETDESEASRLASSVAAVVAHPFRSEISAGAPLAVAVPAAMGPLSRRALRSGFAAAGVTLGEADLVERPIAALAWWLAEVAERAESADHGAGSGVVVALDNDGGELSAAIADLSTQRLLACAPLSIGPRDDRRATEARLRRLVSQATRVDQLILSGSGASHPELLEMMSRIFSTTVTATTDPHAVVFGALHLDTLASFRCLWTSPTGAVAAEESAPETVEHVEPESSGEAE